jgi:hypothetical protein
MNSTLERIEAAQASRRQRSTKREVQRLGSSGILTVWDANCSIADRRAKEESKLKRKADKAYKEAYGHLPPAPPVENQDPALYSEMVEESGNRLFIMDSIGSRS